MPSANSVLQNSIFECGQDDHHKVEIIPTLKKEHFTNKCVWKENSEQN